MTPEPCSDEAIEQGCTCQPRAVRMTDISPDDCYPTKHRKDCPISGYDPDAIRDRMIDDRLTGDA